MVKIPLRKIPSQTLRIVLGGQNCIIHIYYRFNATYLDLQVDDIPICTGAICRNLASICQVASAYFDGSLHFLDMIGDNDPKYTGFGERYRLFYVTLDETLPARFAR